MQFGYWPVVFVDQRRVACTWSAMPGVVQRQQMGKSKGFFFLFLFGFGLAVFIRIVSAIFGVFVHITALQMLHQRNRKVRCHDQEQKNGEIRLHICEILATVRAKVRKFSGVPRRHQGPKPFRHIPAEQARVEKRDLLNSRTAEIVFTKRLALTIFFQKKSCATHPEQGLAYRSKIAVRAGIGSPQNSACLRMPENVRLSD
ncbi:MAG: hypothetical protein IT260_16980 [Saprospiraceae bacterium]|nr:hypothetical protein [Saprospiraceae bacterium]